jgi:hypothetical protein
MSPDQELELIKHMSKIDERGKPLNKGTIPWVINEALKNIEKIEKLLGPKHDRPSKKELKPILKDLRDQLRELKIRLD